jgi:hypothetical protein
MGHKDNDVSKWVLGISGNVFKQTGNIATFNDGFKMKGGFFYVADYGFLIDYSQIDGVVEQIWRGNDHIHGTALGEIEDEKRFTRYGSSTQINERLTHAVNTYKKKQKGGIVDDDIYYYRFKFADE